MKQALIILLIPLLSFCVSMPEITPEQAAMSRSEATSKSECYRMQAAIQSTVWGSLTHVPQEQRAMAMMMMSQNEATRQLVAMATGRSADVCSGDTNFHDVEVQFLKSQTALQGKYIDLAKWGVGMGLGYLAVESITSSLADAATGITIAATDNAKVNYQSQNKDAFQQAGNDLTTSGDNNLVNNNDDCIDCDNDDPVEADQPNTGCTIDAQCLEGQICAISEGSEIGICEDEVSINPVATEPDFDVTDCISNPPWGFSGSTSLFSPGCSCSSHWRGDC